MDRKETSTNFENEQQLKRCPVSYTMGFIGGRWKTAIIQQLLHGPVRFGQIREGIGLISDRMLTKQLKEMQADGLVERRAHAQQPRRVDYALTAKGRSLQPILEAMLSWGLEHMPGREVEGE